MWNGASFGLRQTCLAPAVPQPTLRCERLARAATGFSSIRPAASKQSANTLSRWLLQHPIRTDLRPKVLPQCGIMRAIGCSIRNATNPFLRDSARGCSIQHAVNPFQHDSSRDCSIRNATNAFQRQLLQVIQYRMLQAISV
jgi:hypothetical protein